MVPAEGESSPEFDWAASAGKGGPQLTVALVANDQPPTPDWVLAELASRGIDLVERQCATGAEVIEVAREAEVVWLFGGSRILTAEILGELPTLRVILRTGTGTDNVPMQEAAQRGITVANTPETTTMTVADHTLGLLFAVVRQIVAQDRLVRQGIWDRDRAWPNWHLSGSVLGLVGFGRIARQVATRAQAFGMRVSAVDPAVTEADFASHGVSCTNLEDLLRGSTFVSIHVPLTSRTHHLIGEAQLRQMRRNAVLINTSRGKIVDEGALVKALTERWIAAAALDVFSETPLPIDHPLLRLENVVLTPHIAGYSDDFWETFWRHSINTLAEIAQGRPPLWTVTAE